MNTKTTQRLKKLNASLDSLFQDLSGYTNEQLNTQPEPGKWSALQVMHHLLIAEGYAQGYVRKKLSFNPKLKNAGLGDKWRLFLLWLYLSAPFKFKAPPAVAEENLPSNSSLATTKAQWQKQRLELAAQLESYSPEIFNKSLYKHPFSGRMTLDGMLIFYQTHFDRHRKQIERTLKAVT